MKSVKLHPAKQWHTNAEATWKGLPSLPLTCTKSADGAATLMSVWRCGLWARIRFLFDGRINLLMLANEEHPPVIVTIGEELKRLEPKELQS